MTTLRNEIVVKVFHLLRLEALIFYLTGGSGLEAIDLEMSGFKVNSGSSSSFLPCFISWIHLYTIARSFSWVAAGISYAAFFSKRSHNSMSLSFSFLNLLFISVDICSGFKCLSVSIPYITFYLPSAFFTIRSASRVVLSRRKARSI